MGARHGAYVRPARVLRTPGTGPGATIYLSPAAMSLPSQSPHLSGRRAVALLLLIVAAGLSYAWWNSDSRRIGRLLGRLEDLVDKRPGEHDLTGLNKARLAGDLFAAHFEIRAPQYRVTTSDRPELVRAIVRFRSRSDTIHTQISDRQQWIDTELDRATVQLVVSFITGLGGLSGSEAYRLQINLVKEGDRWWIDYLELLEVLAGPRGR